MAALLPLNLTKSPVENRQGAGGAGGRAGSGDDHKDDDT
jgi:hypothetical protein